MGLLNFMFNRLPSSAQELACSLPLVGNSVRAWNCRQLLKVEQGSLDQNQALNMPNLALTCKESSSSIRVVSDIASRSSSSSDLKKEVIVNKAAECKFPIRPQEIEELADLEQRLAFLKNLIEEGQKQKVIVDLCDEILNMPLGKVIRFADNSPKFESFCQENQALKDYWWSKILKYPNDLSVEQKAKVNSFDYLREDSDRFSKCFYEEYEQFKQEGMPPLIHEKVYDKGQFLVPTVEKTILNIYNLKMKAAQKGKRKKDRESYAVKIAALSGFKMIMREQHKAISALQKSHYQNNELIRQMADRALASLENNVFLGSILMGITYDHIGDAYLKQRKFLLDQRGPVAYVEDYKYLTKLAEACFKIAVSKFYTLKKLCELGIWFDGELELFMSFSNELAKNPSWSELKVYMKDFYRLADADWKEAKTIGGRNAYYIYEKVSGSLKTPCVSLNLE